MERLHHVAAMQIDEVIAWLDELMEDVVGQRFREGAVAIARERTVRILPVLG